MTPYRPRRASFLELWTPGNDWRIKFYGIAHERPSPNPELVAAARDAALGILHAIPRHVPHHHLGYLVAHEGRTNGFVFLDYWAHENEIYHHCFFSSADDLSRLENVTATGRAACIWDLALQAFERDAWVKHVLRQADTPDFDGYLAARLDTEV